MSKLREKLVMYAQATELDKARSGEVNAIILEQITDDFAVRFLIWIVTDNNVPIIKDGVSIEQHATELQQYFKDNIYE